MTKAILEPETDLPPAGSRSGAGAQSVLPFLSKTLQGRPASADIRELRLRELNPQPERAADGP